MTVTATLPVPTASVVPAAAKGSTPGAAAGFADALQLMLAGPTAEEPQQEPQDEPATGADNPADTPQTSVFALAQAVPAQLAHPAAQQAPPLTVPAPDASPVPACPTAFPLESSQVGAAQSVPAQTATPAAGTPAQAVSAAPVTPVPAAMPTPQPPSGKAAQEAPAQQIQQALQPAPAAAGAGAAGETLASVGLPQGARPARQPVTPQPVLLPSAPATAVPGVMPAAAMDAPAAVQSAVAQALSFQALSVQPVPVKAAGAGSGVVPATVPVVPGADNAPVFATVAAPLLATGPASVAIPVPAAPLVPVPEGFTAQLAKPLFTLAAAGTGEHTMSVQVNPDKLGPVTIQAHIGAGGIRIEMFAASADGRDVLRAALPDLKRDLAGAGISASLDLSSNSQSGSPHGGQDRESFTRRVATSYHAPINDRPLEVKDTSARTRPGPNGSETVLDVMA